MRAVNTKVGRLQLRNDETLVRVASTPVVRPPRLPDPIEAMARITGVPDSAAIGTRPPLAGTSLAGNEDSEFRLFEALFGRDALFIARFTRAQWPALSVTTFEALASLQGLPLEDAPQPDLYGRRLERPGRIPHESRAVDDPIARQLIEKRNWAFPYYYSDDATPLFVRDLARFALLEPDVLERRVIQRDGVERALLDALGAGLQHVLASLGPRSLLFSSRGPQDPSGALHAYPVWQDSFDAHFRRDGELALGPVAMLEVQTYVFDALQAVATLVQQQPCLQSHLGFPTTMLALADRIRESVIDEFWVGGRSGYFVPGVEHTGRLLQHLGGRKSTMGALLDSGMLLRPSDKRYATAVVHTLFDRARGMATPWGVRTLGSRGGCDRYRPDAYHNGTVWLFDNHVMARGLHAHGWHGIGTWLNERVIRACYELAMFPEFIRGDSTRRPLVTEYTADTTFVHPDGREQQNRIAQPPQLVQGWTVAAFLGAARQLGQYPLRAADAGRRGDEVRLLSELGRRAAVRGDDDFGR